MTKRWHVISQGDTLTVSRALPPRFDLRASARFPMAHRLRLATQIRQDMWRALQALRGFRPVVAVTRHADGLMVEAGGALDEPAPAQARDVLASLLADPARHRRWLAYARCRP